MSQIFDDSLDELLESCDMKLGYAMQVGDIKDVLSSVAREVERIQKQARMFHDAIEDNYRQKKADIRRAQDEESKEIDAKYDALAKQAYENMTRLSDRINRTHYLLIEEIIRKANTSKQVVK